VSSVSEDDEMVSVSVSDSEASILCESTDERRRSSWRRREVQDCEGVGGGGKSPEEDFDLEPEADINRTGVGVLPNEPYVLIKEPRAEE